MIFILRYEFSCTAFNTTAIVESEVFSNPFIPLWKPPKPKIKSLKIQHNEAELKFSCDDDAIDEYKATYKITTKPKTSTYNLKSDERSCKLTNLNNGVSYEVIVTAQNCLGILSSLGLFTYNQDLKILNKVNNRALELVRCGEMFW